MKAQFFLLGAVLISVLLFAGLPKSQPVLPGQSNDLPFYSDNIASELPRALNDGLNKSSPRTHLKEFTSFVSTEMSALSINLTALWIITQPSGNGIDITAGNFLGTEITLVLTVGASSESIQLSHNSTGSTIITTPGRFNLTLEYGTVSKTIELLRDKANLYAVLTLERDGDMVVNEILA